MIGKKELLKMLDIHLGGEELYPVAIYSRFKYSKGIMDLIKGAECYWLFSDLSYNLTFNKKYKDDKVTFAIVKIKVFEDNRCEITLRDDIDEEPWYREKYEYTNFPLDEFEVYLVDDTFLLKNEH